MSQRERHVGERAEVRKQRVRLEDEPHPAPQWDEPRLRRDRSRRERESVHDDAPAVERLQCGHDAQRRRFPHARRPHQRDDLAACDIERQRAEHVPRAIADRQLVDHEQRAHAAGLQRRSSRRAKRASGSDIARYTAAQSAPGTTQLPTLVA